MSAISYLDRYRAGEHEQVWAELLALGPAVREAPLAADAWAVARETMTRARHNVALLVERLPQLGYRFAYPQNVWVEPNELSLARLYLWEEWFGPLPMSLYAWQEIIGAVDLRGAHPRLAMYSDIDWGGSDHFYAEHWYSDPLVIFPFDDLLIESEQAAERNDVAPGPPFVLTFTLDAITKSNVSGAGGSTITVPERAIDAPQDSADWNGVPIVTQVRTSFQWGGFPGLGHAFPWSRQPPDPTQSATERAFLTAGMLPI